MEIVGLNIDHATRYPHEFSGGQRQRIIYQPEEEAVHCKPHNMVEIGSDHWVHQLIGKGRY